MSLKIVNSALDGVPEISLRGMIDRYEDGSIAALIDNCGASKLRMNINSAGGGTMLGKEVIASMQQFKDNGGIIETVNRGLAASTAGWIFAAGSKGHRKMMPFSIIITHPPMYSDGSTLADYQIGSEKYNILMDELDNLIDIFVSITRKTRNFIKKVMLNTTKFNAKQAVKEGFADEVLSISNHVILKDNLQPEEIINATEYIDYEIINSNNSTQKKVKMKAVAQLLNLNPEASEGAIIEAVKAVVNRADTAEAGITANKTVLEQKETEILGLRNEIKEVKEADVINYVEKYMGDNKERLEAKDKLMNMANSDFDTFKQICPIDGAVVVNNSMIIDNGIQETAAEVEAKTAGIENATKFFNMSQPDKTKLKKDNMAEYNKLVNAYNTHGLQIV